MWKQLPQHGKPLAEVRIEGSGKSRDVIIIPRGGERLRFPASEEIMIETVGHVLVRTNSIDATSVRLTFGGAGDLRLDRAEVSWNDTEEAWNHLWRRARMRSLPWWREEEQEIELDWVLEARLTIACPTRTRKRSS
jgi:hypothetical protein